MMAMCWYPDDSVDDFHTIRRAHPHNFTNFHFTKLDFNPKIATSFWLAMNQHIWLSSIGYQWQHQSYQLVWEFEKLHQKKKKEMQPNFVHTIFGIIAIATTKNHTGVELQNGWHVTRDNRPACIDVCERSKISKSISLMHPQMWSGLIAATFFFLFFSYKLRSCLFHKTWSVLAGLMVFVSYKKPDSSVMHTCHWLMVVFSSSIGKQIKNKLCKIFLKIAFLFRRLNNF